MEGHELTNYLFDCGLFVERRKCEKVRERVSDRGLTHPLEFRSNNETKKRGNGGHSLIEMTSRRKDNSLSIWRSIKRSR